MTASEIITVAVIVLIIGATVGYIIKAKLSGKKCIGCPDSGTCQSKTCGGNCSCCSGCGETNE